MLTFEIVSNEKFCFVFKLRTLRYNANIAHAHMLHQHVLLGGFSDFIHRRGCCVSLFLKGVSQ